MKDLDITQVFCEVLTGLGGLAVALSVFALAGPYTTQAVLPYMTRNLTVASLGGLIVVAYLVGTMMDAVGMAMDELFLYRLVVKSKAEPSDDDRAKFWKSVSTHVLAYREAQWTYYSCYRNLFLLFLPGSALWTTVVWIRAGKYWGMGTGISFVILETAFFITMRALVDIYFRITKSL